MQHPSEGRHAGGNNTHLDLHEASDSICQSTDMRTEYNKEVILRHHLYVDENPGFIFDMVPHATEIDTNCRGYNSSVYGV